MTLTDKGKASLNLLIKNFGAVKGRRMFYYLEEKHPDWVNKWRENKMKQKMYRNRDGTGPSGAGPRTGRGRGGC